MIIRPKSIWQGIALLTLMAMMGCNSPGGPLPVELTTVPPTAPATLPEVIAALSSYSAEARITAALAVPKFGKDAVAAVPALIQNLHYEPTSGVREAAAFALGQVGPDARSAVPELIGVLQNDDVVNVRRAAAGALGRINNPSAVPALASILYEKVIEGKCEELVRRYPESCRLEQHYRGAVSCSCGGEIGHIMERTSEWLLLESAVAIASITGEDFPDADSELNEEGIPPIVIAAREWWEEEGQFEDW